MSEVYLNPLKDYSGDFIETDTILPLESRELDGHFENVAEEEVKLFLADGSKRCINLDKAVLSGGTYEGMTENIILITWQHCE